MSSKAAKARKHIRAQLEALTRPQLIALATQKTELNHGFIKSNTKEYLVWVLTEVEDVLVPVQA